MSVLTLAIILSPQYWLNILYKSNITLEFIQKIKPWVERGSVCIFENVK